jgi:hypothetical protein
VSKIPATVIEKNGNIIRRWDGVVPLSEEFKQYFEEAAGARTINRGGGG